MMKAARKQITTALTLLLTSFVVITSSVACGDGSDADDGDSGPIRCEYEESSTSCNGSTYSTYKKKCLDIEDPKSGYTPSAHCSTITSDTSECASSCCVKYRFRNAKGSYGRCP